MIAQAAAGAILTVAVANGEAGTQRLVDALIGVGVALLFTQVLFSPEPLALLRRAEAAALADMAEALHLTAQALEHDDDDVAEKAMNHLRTLRDRLSELGRTRAASGRVARRSAVWRSQIAPVVRETEDAGRLDLLGGSCLALVRAAMATDEACRRQLAPHTQAPSPMHSATSHGRQASVPAARRQPTGRSTSPGGSPPRIRPPTRRRSPRSSHCVPSPATSWRSPVSTPSRPRPQCGKGLASSASRPSVFVASAVRSAPAAALTQGLSSGACQSDVLISTTCS